MIRPSPVVCSHTDTVPVETIAPHLPESTPVVTVVAHLCTSCNQQLPANWGCGDCEWVSVRRVCDPVPTLRVARRCPTHDTQP